MTRPISDHPAPVAEPVDYWLIQRRLEKQQRLADGIAAEARHQADDDTPWNRLACDHPDKCSCDADYPGWTPGAIA
ncbi:hypothetical protein ACGFZR_15490 [Streptomyces sp. NPDC048241]|uniref:hypothetical protein n=1 Tax=Streptomyces sp. NPDC048241 TaxID=3365521 RepID=UPI00371897B2